MAILKHIAIKNADYGKALTYLRYQHDERHQKPILDANGNMLLRDEIYLDGINCCAETFDLECEMLNRQHHKNHGFDEIKSHHYIISFDPSDKDECGLTGEQAQAIGMEYARKNFSGHQALVCTHMDGHNGSGNIHVHIIINSLRKFDAEQEAYTERPIDRKAGYKHHLTDGHLRRLKQSLMDICLRENLNQVDLLNPPSAKITEQEYRAKQRGQAELDKINAEILADGLTPMKTKFQTEKEKIRNAIIAAAKKSGSFEEFQKLLQSEYGIVVKDHRGRFSYLPNGRQKYISARTLGSNFDREHLLRIFDENALAAQKGPKQHCPDNIHAVLFAKSKLRLVVDLQTCVKAQQSRAYAQKVKISNLQQMANTIAFVQEHRYDTQMELLSARDNISAKLTQAQLSAKATDTELKAINQKIHYTGQYLSSRAVYSKFLKAEDKERFCKKYADEIDRHEEALRFLKQNSSDGKFASLSNLRMEKEMLASKRIGQYETCAILKEQLGQLQTACDNVNTILGHAPAHETKCRKSNEIDL